MNWREVRSAVKSKLGGTISDGTKHDIGLVSHNGLLVGRVLISRGAGELRGHETGNCARSLGISEGEFKRLVSCTLSAEDFFAKIAPQ